MSTIYATTKLCNACETTKLLTDFYKHPSSKDGYHKACKDCYKAHRKHYRPKSKEFASLLSEQSIINLLRARGIYATAGKNSEYKYVDVVAWGCVKIEVKFSHITPRCRFNWTFTPTQMKNGIKSDVVILVAIEPHEANYYVFSTDHPCFYLPNGTLKHGITYRPNARAYSNNRYGASLTDEIMKSQFEAWDLIERERLTVAKLYQDETLVMAS